MFLISWASLRSVGVRMFSLGKLFFFNLLLPKQAEGLPERVQTVSNVSFWLYGRTPLNKTQLQYMCNLFLGSFF